MLFLTGALFYLAATVAASPVATPVDKTPTQVDKRDSVTVEASFSVSVTTTALSSAIDNCHDDIYAAVNDGEITLSDIVDLVGDWFEDKAEKFEEAWDNAVNAIKAKLDEWENKIEFEIDKLENQIETGLTLFAVTIANGIDDLIQDIIFIKICKITMEIMFGIDDDTLKNMDAARKVLAKPCANTEITVQEQISMQYISTDSDGTTTTVLSESYFSYSSSASHSKRTAAPEPERRSIESRQEAPAAAVAARSEPVEARDETAEIASRLTKRSNLEQRDLDLNDDMCAIAIAATLGSAMMPISTFTSIKLWIQSVQLTAELTDDFQKKSVQKVVENQREGAWLFTKLILTLVNVDQVVKYCGVDDDIRRSVNGVVVNA